MLAHESLIEALDTSDEDRQLIIAPLLDRDQVGSSSIDMRLGTEFLQISRTTQGILDPFAEHDEQRIVVPFGEGLVIHPGQFLLGSTLEFLCVPTCLGGQVLTRSSWARNGLVVATAVTVHPGFRGSLTLELVNMGTVPLQLRTGTRIAQLVLWELAGAATMQAYPVAGKYRDPIGPESSRLDRERDEHDRIIRVGRALFGPPPGPPSRATEDESA